MLQPIEPNEHQESVWDYPRPPRLEPTTKLLRVVFSNIVIAETSRGYRVLETSHPPTYYFPPDDVELRYLSRTARTSLCEWKGRASYYSLVVGARNAPDVAWFYPQPMPDFAALKDYIAFYAGPMDGCFVDDERVTPQPGGFYGGWITSAIVGPFKGLPGSRGW